MNFIEYFENILNSQSEDNCKSQREIVVLVEHGQTVDYIRFEMWRLCQKLKLGSKLDLEYEFDKITKIFTITKRQDGKIWTSRVYVRRIDKNKLDKLNELRPDGIVVFGSFSAEQVEVLMKYIQNSNKPGLEVAFLNR